MFINIEGNIGSGKSSLAKLLAQEMDALLMLEQFDDNPFLPEFYNDPTRYAFSVEVSFLYERFRQIRDELNAPNLFYEHVISDYSLGKTAIFASENLNHIEFELFLNLYQQLYQNVPLPDVLVYISRPVGVLKHFIAKRNRSYEQTISSDYLMKIDAAYTQHLFRTLDQPTLIFHLEDFDFLIDVELFRKMKDYILSGDLKKKVYNIYF